jgi:hypothetical protein
MMIKPGEEILPGAGHRFRVLDVLTPRARLASRRTATGRGGVENGRSVAWVGASPGTRPARRSRRSCNVNGSRWGTRSGVLRPGSRSPDVGFFPASPYQRVDRPSLSFIQRLLAAQRRGRKWRLGRNLAQASGRGFKQWEGECDVQAISRSGRRGRFSRAGHCDLGGLGGGK